MHKFCNIETTCKNHFLSKSLNLDVVKPFQNPREANSRSRILLISLVYVCIYLFVYVCHASWSNEKRYRLEIWYIYSQGPYLKTGFFKKISVTATSFEKLTRHVDFPHISSIVLLLFFF